MARAWPTLKLQKEIREMLDEQRICPQQLRAGNLWAYRRDPHTMVCVERHPLAFNPTCSHRAWPRLVMDLEEQVRLRGGLPSRSEAMRRQYDPIKSDLYENLWDKTRTSTLERIILLSLSKMDTSSGCDRCKWHRQA